MAALAGIAPCGAPSAVARAGAATSAARDSRPESLANLNADLIPPHTLDQIDEPYIPPPFICLNG
ncbi:hypothetical protein PR003_g16949 [Phytophthora rubi]|uniref:Uncharacterized protein n=1 Tax=Phytophthora rubi TaxID=129364 RepID=A0A6A3KHL6_9STRA|nr:hypothetical protein PR002_g16453 [Phytophthora rubi]KAE9010094.1 hypothetical protein PR001_g16271 [Phytophthora rubi]KAE9323540.1 hypothetical protein PR003_g16949 [Phytophthora rubi]